MSEQHNCTIAQSARESRKTAACSFIVLTSVCGDGD